MRYYVQF